MKKIVTECVVFMILFGSFQARLTKTCDGINGTSCCLGFKWDLTQKKCLPCAKGYMGLSCESKCTFPSYGLGCQSHCNCIEKDCDPANGCRHSSRDITSSRDPNTSLIGLDYKTVTTEVLNSKVQTAEPCKKGYNGTNCKQKCPFPSYGLGCQRKCNCIDKVCDHINGCMQPTRYTFVIKDYPSPSTSLKRQTVTAYIFKSEVNTFENIKSYIDKTTTCTTSNQPAKRNKSLMFALIGLSIVALIIVFFMFMLDY